LNKINSKRINSFPSNAPSRSFVFRKLYQKELKKYQKGERRAERRERRGL
jgi:hypothetical protein